MSNIIFPSDDSAPPMVGHGAIKDRPTVSDLLDTKGHEVIAASKKTSVGTAASILHDRCVGVLVITDSMGRLAGVLSERDLIALIADHTVSDIRALTIGDVMTEDVVTCTPDADILEVLDVMWNKHFRHMPVVERGAVCGVVSRTDILHHLRSAAETDSEEVLWGKLVNQL
jgi:CBS domain-containing protein